VLRPRPRHPPRRPCRDGPTLVGPPCWCRPGRTAREDDLQLVARLGIRVTFWWTKAIGVIRKWCLYKRVSSRQAQRTERARWAQGALAAFVAMLCLVFCSTQTGQPSVDGSALLGRWAGQEGTLIFSADHTFIGRDLQLSPSFGPGCDDVSGTGTWQFLSPTEILAQASLPFIGEISSVLIGEGAPAFTRACGRAAIFRSQPGGPARL